MIEDISVNSIDADGLTGTWGTVVTGGTNGGTTGSITWPLSVQTGISATTLPTPANYGTLTGSLGNLTSVLSNNLAASVSKTSVSYIIIKRNGDTLEFKQDSPISINEMISIAKFISLTTSTVKIQWSTIISTLGIERHFIKGRPQAEYLDNTSELFVKLFDAE